MFSFMFLTTVLTTNPCFLMSFDVPKCTSSRNKKNPAALCGNGVSVCGSNRTRTYDTPGMKRVIVHCTIVDLLNLYKVQFRSDYRFDYESAFLSAFSMSSRTSFLI
jgi:hypothetical protein